MEKSPASRIQQTFCKSIYTFYCSWILLPYKLYKCTKGSFWKRRVFKTASGSSVETQVSAEAGGTADTKSMKF